MEVVEHRARAMASEVHIAVVGGDVAMVAHAMSRLAELERRWSRFLPDSEITELNQSGGWAVEVHPDTLLLVECLIEANRLTRGRFDPTLLPALAAAGYEASVERPERRTNLPDRAQAAVRLDTIVVDRRSGTVRLPRELTLDPGGLGKGLAADLVAVELVSAGAAGVLVGVGGDVAVAGSPSQGGGRWQVDVEDPHDSQRVVAHLSVGTGGVATSSTLSRRWIDADGIARHHLIDPTTGQPVVTDVVAATVSAPTAWLAEAFATEAVVAGSARGMAILGEHDTPAVLVRDDGAILETTGSAP